MIKINRGSFKGVFFKIFLGIIGVFLFLEIIFRLSAFIFYFFEEKENLLKINKQKNFTILCLGESVTFGFGNKDSYPAQLEEILNQSHEKIKFTVINKGIVSISLDNLMILVDQFLVIYKPDVVVAMLGLNDGSIAYYKDINFLDEKLFKVSKFYKFLKLLWINLQDKKISKHSYTQENLNKLRAQVNYNNKDPQLFFKLSEYLFFFDQLEEAKAMIIKSIKLDDRNLSAYVFLSLINTRLSLLDESEKVLLEAKEKFPGQKIVFFKLAQLYVNVGKMDLAEKELENCYANNSSDYFSIAELGWFYYLKGDIAKTEKLFKKNLVVNSGSDKSYVLMGDFYLKEKKADLARIFYKKALDINKNNSLARSKLKSLDNSNKINFSELSYYHYLRLKEKLDPKGIKLVCMSYPMRSVVPIKKIFNNEKNIIFVDNKKIFEQAVGIEGEGQYFFDMFAGDFGHCTAKGNRLIADNLAGVLQKEFLNSR